MEAHLPAEDISILQYMAPHEHHRTVYIYITVTFLICMHIMWYQLTIECLYRYTLTAGVHLGGGGIYQALCKDSLEET